MRFARAFIERPIMAGAINLIILLIGLVAFSRLELRHQPNIRTNEFQISTSYRGANAQIIENRITKLTFGLCFARIISS